MYLLFLQSETMPRCLGTTQKGLPCKCNALVGDTFCRAHAEKSVNLDLVNSKFNIDILEQIYEHHIIFEKLKKLEKVYELLDKMPALYEEHRRTKKLVEIKYNDLTIYFDIVDQMNDVSKCGVSSYSPNNRDNYEYASTRLCPSGFFLEKNRRAPNECGGLLVAKLCVAIFIQLGFNNCVQEKWRPYIKYWRKKMAEDRAFIAKHKN